MSKTTRFGDPQHTLYLLDISSFIFRAFFAVRPLHTKTGEPTNAVYGVATMLARIAEEARPEFMAVAYDSKGPSFREELYAEYKANRSEPPEELVPQFARIDQLVSAFDIHSYRLAGMEADDLIGSLARKWCDDSPSNQVVIVSSDKDLMQLVNERVRIWDTMSNKVYTGAEVEEKMGVGPAQVRDYLGLVGDSSDNIPGVSGIGPKGAAELLKQFGNLEGVLAAAREGRVKGKKGETLIEQAAIARLSAELATVKCDLDLHVKREDFGYRFHVNEACRKLLEELDFHSLVHRWATQVPEMGTEVADAKPHAESPAESPASVAPSSGFATGRIPRPEVALPPLSDEPFRLINSPEDFEELIEKLKTVQEFGFDVETTSLNPREASLVGFAISYDPTFGVYIPVGHRGTSVEQLPVTEVLIKLKPFLENPEIRKVGQNLKYDWEVLLEMGLRPDGIGADTMVAGYILDPEGRHNLQTLAGAHLGYAVTTYEQVCGSGRDQLGFDQVPIDQATRYSAEDAVIALRLWHKLRAHLLHDQLLDVFARVDLPLVSVLARIEREGVWIDTEWLKKLSGEFSSELRAIEERVAVFTNGPINLNSPKQLGHLLFDVLKLPPQGKTKTGFSTDASVLDALAPLHEVPKLLLEYREISKLKGTYVDPLPLLRDPKTGKIHASFHQTVAATGRLSSSDPNLQNIPIRSERGRKIRRAFIPSVGNVLVAADYSQIELRLLAHMSGDPELMRSFQQDEDVHRRTAGEIFGIEPGDVDDRQRGIAKAINFGLMYGKTAFGLAQELKIPRKEAQEVIHRYFARYSKVKEYLDSLIQGAREKGYVETLLGRKRVLHDINSRNPAMRNNAERMAMNTPIQGTAADLMKLAMIEIDRALRECKLRSKLIIQVHDEVVLDCPRGEADEVQKLVCDTMENAMTLSIPLKVNSAMGANWMDL